MGLESIRKPKAAIPEVENRMRESLRDMIFDQLVAGKVLDTFQEELDDAEFDHETQREIANAFASLAEADKRAVLAIPAQLRPQVFARYAKQVEAGTLTGAGMMEDMLAKAKKYGFTLGFHLSPNDIKQEKDGSWNIRGTEKDHRHNNMPMAYYSMDYSNRYLKKPSRFLYVIRAETGEHTSHYPDNDGTWGHASSLAIIDKIDLKALEEEMNARFKSMEAKEKGDVQ